ncbi:MAG: hypothetical protein HYW78_00975 [Parcubacteria group bacterium]|nr:hypothetical protein [Parcubacteria group bacterium]
MEDNKKEEKTDSRFEKTVVSQAMLERVPFLMEQEEPVIEQADVELAHKAEEVLDGKRNLKDIADDIIASYETRVKVVGGIIEDTHKMMNDFKEKRETMAGELQEVLAKCESLRKKDFDRLMSDIVARQNEREKEVRTMLEIFRAEEEMVAEKLKNLLTKGEEVRIKDFKKMMIDIRQEQEKRVRQTGESVAGQLQEMRAEVHTMLDNFKKERQSVATAWHEILNLFHREKSSAHSIRNSVTLNVANQGNSEIEEKQAFYGTGDDASIHRKLELEDEEMRGLEDIKNNDDNK